MDLGTIIALFIGVRVAQLGYVTSTDRLGIQREVVARYCPYGQALRPNGVKLIDDMITEAINAVGAYQETEAIGVIRTELVPKVRIK